MKKVISSILLICAAVAIAVAQKQPVKPWDEWTDKDVKKILDNSAWGQIQTDTGQDIFAGGTTNRPQARGSEQGLSEQPPVVDYHIRLLSAKPIRAAFMRQLALKQKGPTKDQMQAFVDRKFDPYIVVSVIYESRDGRFPANTAKAFSNPNMELLRKNTYLERTDGKRVPLKNYIPPSSDGLGAKFIFDRADAGKPFVSTDIPELRFIAEVPAEPGQTGGTVTYLKLNMRFKIAEMTYDGILEY
jgi:hypothetical protein